MNLKVLISKTKEIEFISDINPFDVVKHKNGEYYEIIDIDIKVQINDEWKEAILYKKFLSNDFKIKFVRAFDDFKSSFVKVEFKK